MHTGELHAYVGALQPSPACVQGAYRSCNIFVPQIEGNHQ